MDEVVRGCAMGGVLLPADGVRTVAYDPNIAEVQLFPLPGRLRAGGQPVRRLV